MYNEKQLIPILKKTIPGKNQPLYNILKNYPIKDNILTCTNLDIAFQGKVDYQDSYNDSEILFKSKRFDAAHYPQTIGAPEEYPKLPEIKDPVNLPINIFYMERKYQYFVGDDKKRPSLTGVFFNLQKDKTNIVATNSEILIENEINIKGPETSFILPPKVLEILNLCLKLSPLEKVEKGKTFISFTGNGWTLISKLIEGSYPNYEMVIPEKYNYTSIQPERINQLIAAVKTLLPLANEKTKQINFNKDFICANDRDNGKFFKIKNPIPEINGLGLNANYLLTILAELDNKPVDFGRGSPLSAVVFKQEGLTLLIMPLRLLEYLEYKEETITREEYKELDKEEKLNWIIDSEKDGFMKKAKINDNDCKEIQPEESNKPKANKPTRIPIVKPKIYIQDGKFLRADGLVEIIRIPPESKPPVRLQGKIIQENGNIGIKFNVIPDLFIRTEMKKKGFRWIGKERIWQAATSEDALSFAKEIIN